MSGRKKRYERDETEERVLRLMDRRYPPSEIDAKLGLAKGTAVDVMRWLWRNAKEGSLRR